MKIEVEEMQNLTVIKLIGNISGIPDETEFDYIIKNLVNKKKLNVIVDLGNINYVSSTGLGIILRGYITIKNSGGSLKLVSLNKRLKTLLEITKLNKIIETYDSIELAI